MNKRSFVVSPMSQKISLQAGDHYTGQITVTNSGNADFNFIVNVSPFNVSADGESFDFSTISTFSEIADWITIANPSGVIAPGKSQKITFSIDVPANAPGGGQYATIDISQATPESESGTIEDIIEIGSIIYADISGETTRDAAIIQNTIPGFITDPNASIITTFKNSGNIHEEAITTLSVKNTITGEKIFPKTNENDTFSQIIMPGTTPIISREINDLPTIGIVRVQQTIQYGGTTSTYDQTLIICPIWLLATATITIIFIVAGVCRHFFRHKKLKF